MTDKYMVSKEFNEVRPLNSCFYKLKNIYCICVQMITTLTEDKQILINVEVRDENRNKAVILSARSRPGIQCPNCYLQKRVDNFSTQSEIVCYEHRYWESFHTRVKQYKYYLRPQNSPSLTLNYN